MAVRVREPVALYHPESGTYVVPKASDYYDETDPLVVAHPWAFVKDENRTENVVEQATAAPGEKRARRAQAS